MKLQTRIVPIIPQMACVAEVYEADRRRIKVGDPATLRSPALGAGEDRALTGRVAQIGRLVATPQVKSLDPLARSDRRVVEVRIDLSPDSVRRAAELVNLEVEVTVGSGP